MKKIGNLIFALFILASCTKVKELEGRTENMDKNTEQMRNITEDMNSTTKDMSGTTEEMNATTQNMSETTLLMLQMTQELKALTEKMYGGIINMQQVTGEMKDSIGFVHPQLRTKESEDTRSKKWRTLLSENASVGEKVVAAVVFMQGFEYQYWSYNDTYDTLHTRHLLIYDAVNEFFGRMLDIYEEIDPAKASPIKKNEKKHSYIMAWNSIAHAIHYNHYIQKALYENKGGFELLSMYDIILNALRKEKNGEELLDYEDLVLSSINKEIAIDLLSARINMLMGLALNYGAQSDKDLSVGRKLGAGWFLLTKKSGKIKLKSKFEKANDSTKRYVLTYLRQAAETMTSMRALGLWPKTDATINNVMDNLILYNNPKGDPLTAEFHQLVKQLRKL